MKRLTMVGLLLVIIIIACDDDPEEPTIEEFAGELEVRWIRVDYLWWYTAVDTVAFVVEEGVYSL
ncbi:MAG: hypothetical protein AB1744_10830, partial [Candidatus Zixiibacteriota bacterium]